MTKFQGEERRANATNWLLVLAAFLIPLLGAAAHAATVVQRVTALEEWRKELKEDIKEIRAGIDELRRRR